ncbi:PKS-NRPS hybrid synthetase [Frankliniella fusca]|nr:PKS-NRPS hybrid synthetase [Frankliniella fusca]
MITVKNFEMKRSSDKLLKEAPCEITINNFHNHPLAIADSLRLRRPTKEVVETFRNLFSAGHSPSSAHRTFTYDIQVKHGEDFFKVLADGSQCPTKQWCYHLYYNMFKENYGSPTGELMLQSLEKAVKKYNSECGSVCAAFQKLGDETIIALCSPLMKRVHYFLKASGEIAFLDAGGGLDRQNNRVFPLLAPSVAGALPLGLVIVSSESEVTITAGLKLLMSLVPPEGFYGRGIKGPAIFMTDDCTAERNALMNIFPDAILLLCLFHILQAFWRYVTDSKHKVNTKDQMYVFELFKEWCYIECEEKFIEFHSDLQQNSQICQYSIVMKHIDDLFDRREEWALCYRSDLLTRGNNTNNYAESSILQLKDSILDRVRAYSLVQLFDFMTTRLELYFERRISVVLNNRKENYYSSKHFIRPEKIIDLVCFQTTFTNFYLVKNLTKKTEYVVDMNLELCGCPIGRNGQACKHQLAVVKQFQLSSSQIIPFHDEEAKLILHRIMSTVEPPSGWYGSLKAGPALVTLGNVVDSNESIDIQDEFGSSETTFTMQPSSAAGNTNFDQAVNDQLKKWSEVSEYVANGLKKHPEVFLSALQKFHMSFERAKSQSENAVLSAFHNFNRAQKHKPVRNRGNIGVNRSSVDRRKTKIGGRRCQQTGRPSKKAFTAEHGYTAQAKKSAWDRGAPQKRAALPHNLTQRVEMTAWKKRKTV